MRKKSTTKIYLTVAIVLLCCFMALFPACAGKKAVFNESSTGPQVLVDPTNISLGVATVMGKEILVKGKGFTPGEKVGVKISGVEEGNQTVEVGICSGDADENGYFQSTVSKQIKIFGILRALAVPTPKGYAVKVVGSPIPAGAYTLTAVGLRSNKTAECPLVLKQPGIGDKLKDWIGSKLGKIL